LSIFYRYLYHFGDFLTFECFCVIRLSSARSQKNFLWQTIRDLSEKFQLEENTDGRWKVDFLKITRKWPNCDHFNVICIHFWGFLSFSDFLCNQIELCEVSKIFSWQTIRDLSEKFQLQENTDGRWKVDLLRITQNWHDYWHFARIVCSF